MSDPGRVSVFTIPSNRSFSDAFAAGLIRRFGKDPLGLAHGRILLPNNRAVRAVTEAFVRASGNGLLLPRLIPVGDPELDERIGGALDRIEADEPPPLTSAGLSTLCWRRKSIRRNCGLPSPRRMIWPGIGNVHSPSCS